MTFSLMLLRAKNVGVRYFRDHASRFVRKHEPIVITERGQREGVLLPYESVLELVDILDELQDRDLLKAIAEGRRAIRAGKKGVLFSESVKKHRKTSCL